MIDEDIWIFVYVAETVWTFIVDDIWEVKCPGGKWPGRFCFRRSGGGDLSGWEMSGSGFFYEGIVREGTVRGRTVRGEKLSGGNCPGGNYPGRIYRSSD